MRYVITQNYLCKLFSFSFVGNFTLRQIRDLPDKNRSLKIGCVINFFGDFANRKFFFETPNRIFVSISNISLLFVVDAAVVPDRGLTLVRVEIATDQGAEVTAEAGIVLHSMHWKKTLFKRRIYTRMCL